jgi:hypothetical protein
MPNCVDKNHELADLYRFDRALERHGQDLSYRRMCDFVMGTSRAGCFTRNAKFTAERNDIGDFPICLRIAAHRIKTFAHAFTRSIFGS